MSRCGEVHANVNSWVWNTRELLFAFTMPTAVMIQTSVVRSIFDSMLLVNTYEHTSPITVAARSKTWTVFARSNTGVMDSNPTKGMDVCVRLFCAYVVLCVGRGLATGWSPVQGVLPTVYGLRNWNSGQGPTKGCSGSEESVSNAVYIFLLIGVQCMYSLCE
jgi:hypothetical protein